MLAGVTRSGAVCVVRGPPGIGKTTMLDSAVENAMDRGFRLLSVGGVQSEAHLPFAGLHALLRSVLDRARVLPDRQRSALFAAFGMSTDDAPKPFVIALAALELIADAASGSSLLLLVDDAQWLDPPTADVLAFVARRIGAEPIAML